MKRKIILIIFALVVSLIVASTIYIIVTPGINSNKPKDINKKNAKVSEIIHDEEVEMLFNIYFNEVRHRFKWVYRLGKNGDKITLNSEIYLDGHQILKENIADDLKIKKFNEFWKNENIYSLLTREVSSFQVITSDKKEYLVFYLTIFNESEKEIYYIMNEEGDILNKEKIIKKDSSKNENTMYFYEGDNLAKIEDNKIYYLLENKDNKVIEEYEITIKDKKLEEKIINTYNIEEE